MRAVRCDVCGTRALTAASKCPKCDNLIELRDGFGDLLPLAYCSSCDSYYPERLGSCRWCGTQPEPEPAGPVIWKGVGVAALVVLAAGAWFMRDSRPHRVDAARVAELLRPDSIPLPGDTSMAHRTARPSDAASTPTTIAAAAPSDSVRQADSASVAAMDAVTPQAEPRAVVAVKPPDKPAATSTAGVASKARKAPAWVNVVSKSWVTVRADASKASRFVVSIGPGTHAQLGETRGTWRRLRAKGITGWVEPGQYFSAARSSTRAGDLAAR